VGAGDRRFFKREHIGFKVGLAKERKSLKDNFLARSQGCRGGRRFVTDGMFLGIYVFIRVSPTKAELGGKKARIKKRKDVSRVVKMEKFSWKNL